jgi:hypothetical protein
MDAGAGRRDSEIAMSDSNEMGQTPEMNEYNKEPVGGGAESVPDPTSPDRPDRDPSDPGADELGSPDTAESDELGGPDTVESNDELQGGADR